MPTMTSQTQTIYEPYTSQTIPGGAPSVSSAQSRHRAFTVTAFNVGSDRKRPTNGTFTKVDFSYPKGTEVQRWPSSTVYITGPLGPGVDTRYKTSFDFATTEKLALNRLYDRLRMSDLNLAVSLAESKVTYDSGRKVINAMGRAASVALEYRRRLGHLMTKKSFRLDPQAPANLWLSLKYGWLPTMSDIYNVATFERRRLLDGVTIQGTAKISDSSVETWIQAGWAPNVVSISENSWTGRTKFAINVKPVNQNAYDFNRLTSINPVAIAWELVPLSFVADWFLDIGGYLQNIEASWGSGLQFNWGYQTNTFKCVSAYTRSGSQYYVPYATTYQYSYKGSCVKKTKARGVLSGFPRPARPSFKVDLSVHKIISGAALIQQRLKLPRAWLGK